MNTSSVGESQQQQRPAAADKCLTRLPWGVVKEKPNLSVHVAQLVQTIGAAGGVQVPESAGLLNIEKRKPGEYLMKLIVFNFAQCASKKLEQIVQGEKRVL